MQRAKTERIEEKNRHFKNSTQLSIMDRKNGLKFNRKRRQFRIITECCTQI
jgi:hypothetical protein